MMRWIIDLTMFLIAAVSLGLVFVLDRKARAREQKTLERLQGHTDQSSINWKEYARGFHKLEHMLLDGPQPYTPSVVLGVSGGGLALADMLSVRYCERMHTLIPVHAIWVQKAYRRPDSQPPDTCDEDLKRWVEGKKVLLVEDFFLGGEALMRLISRITAQNPKELRVLCFAVPKKYVGSDGLVTLCDSRIDYWSVLSNSSDFTMPWGRT